MTRSWIKASTVRARAILPWLLILAPSAALAVSSPAIPHDLSPLGMYQQADWVVKGVMLGLILASLLTWTVALVKGLQLWRAGRQARHCLARLASSPRLPEPGEMETGPGGLLLAAAREELRESGPLPVAGIKERLERRFVRIESGVARGINGGTGVLATVGSTAPFIGLFGTVWGIMNSFIGISEAQTTNLAVVAPGIAEALLATALGLVAAIPAVIAYNALARKISGYRTRVAGIAQEVMRLVSLQLDRERSESWPSG